jgi:hypothetical protein
VRFIRRRIYALEVTKILPKQKSLFMLRGKKQRTCGNEQAALFRVHIEHQLIKTGFYIQ